MSAFTKPNISAVNAAGILAFETSGYAEVLKNGMASSDAATTNQALETVKELCEGVDQWIEPFMLDTLTAIMDNLGNEW
jgi:hypothetical protein